jgi:hypothetical protein
MSDLYADTVRWWGYLRVSTSAQALDGYGLDTQLEGIRTWVAGNGGRLAGHSKDAGASGALDLDQRDGLLGRRVPVPAQRLPGDRRLPPGPPVARPGGVGDDPARVHQARDRSPLVLEHRGRAGRCRR